MDEIEGILIEIIEPKLNKQGGRLRAADEYFQHIDQKVMGISNEDIQDSLNNIGSKLG